MAKLETKKPYLVALTVHRGHGRSNFTAICSKCGTTFTVYIWSFHGRGKKCPNCKQLYSLRDVRKPAVIKFQGRYVFKVGEWLYDVNGVRIK